MGALSSNVKTINLESDNLNIASKVNLIIDYFGTTTSTVVQVVPKSVTDFDLIYSPIVADKENEIQVVLVENTSIITSITVTQGNIEQSSTLLQNLPTLLIPPT